MQKKNVLSEKTHSFSIEIIHLYQDLTKQKQFSLGDQVLRSGTSIGANLQEAIGGQSKRDFYSKICISYKEARETLYWLILLKDSQVITEERIQEPLALCYELIRLLSATKQTLQKNI